jgi:DNA polymerase-3 subunit epsilon
MSWAFGPMAPFDTETSGPDPMTARLVSATVAEVGPGVDTRIVEHLVAVDDDIPAEATAVHGITTEHARANGKPAVEVVEAVAAHLTELMAAGTPVVGMNLGFDFTLLQRELWRCGVKDGLEDRGQRQIGPLIDVFVIDKAIDRYRPGGRKLTDLCEFYGVRLDGAHDATFDALGAARVAFKMCKRAELAQRDPQAVAALYADRPRQKAHIVRAFQRLGAMTLQELHAQQAVWYREQAEGLVAFWRQKANQFEHEAGRAADDAERETKLADANDLRNRADSVGFDWPLRAADGAQ